MKSSILTLYLNEDFCMWKTLLKETARLQEMSLGYNPFVTDSHLGRINGWKNNYLYQSIGTLDDERRAKLLFFKEEIIEIWLRVILYGKLAGISLESAIFDDFCYKDGITRVSYHV